MAIANNFFNGRPTFLNDFANGQTLDNRITFLRSGAAVYYDGKSSALAEQNLIIQSNNFTTSWSLNAVATPTQNATDPSGTTNNAWTIAPSANLGQHILSTSSNVTVLASTNYVCTAYVQAGGSNYATLTLSASSSAYIALPINLTSGSVALGTPTTGASFTYVSSSITQVGSTAWYRVALIFSTALTSFYPSIQINNTFPPTISSYGYQVNWTATGTETILLYGFQLEQRSTATAYNQTTTTAINNFIPTLQSAPINTPRFDFNPVTGESLGLLVEGSSTNLFNYSEDFTNAYWGKPALPVTASATIAPDGNQTGQLLTVTTSNVTHQLYSSATAVTNGSIYTFSVYLKYYGQQFAQLVPISASLCNFDLLNGIAGTPTNGTANIIPVGNGWYRCSYTFTGNGTSPNFIICAAQSLTSSIQPAFAGNGFNGFYAWGAQLELTQNAGASSALTSYIKTTSASVTRAAEYPTVTATNFSTFFNNSQGTWYVEAQGGYYASTGYCDAFVLGNASSSSVMRLIAQLNATQAQAAGPGGSISLTTNSLVNGVGQPNKIAFTYSNSSLTGSALGVATVSSSTNNAVPTATQMVIGYNISSQGWLNGHIKKLAYYPTAMTGANLQALTGS